MAFPQFGYPGVSASLGVGQGSLLLASAASGSAANPGLSVATSRASELPSRGAESPGSTPPSAGSMCPCYPPPAAALLGLSRPHGIQADSAAAAAALYSGQYPGCFFPLGSDPSALLTTSMGGVSADMKSPPDFGLIPSSSYFGAPYDPALAAAAFSPYANSFALDPNARRKNATRESTNTLKAWLNEHRKNPYPTKGEKIMLAIITKMTLTQVSTWFANARRRLKKENRVTWSPRNRCDDDDDDDDDDKDGSEAKDDLSHHGDPLDSDVDIENDDAEGDRSTRTPEPYPIHTSTPTRLAPVPHPITTRHSPSPGADSPNCSPNHPTDTQKLSSQISPKCVDTSPQTRPKIWSMVELASSKDDERRAGSETEPKESQRLTGTLHMPATHPAFAGTLGKTHADLQSLGKNGSVFSAFRPPVHAHGHSAAGSHPLITPSQVTSGGVHRPNWPHGLSTSHPAYSYALTQHYLAMQAAAGQRNHQGLAMSAMAAAASSGAHAQSAALLQVAQRMTSSDGFRSDSKTREHDNKSPNDRECDSDKESRSPISLTSHKSASTIGPSHHGTLQTLRQPPIVS